MDEPNLFKGHTNYSMSNCIVTPVLLIVVGQVGSGQAINYNDYKYLEFLLSKTNIDYVDKSNSKNVTVKYISNYNINNVINLAVKYKNSGYIISCLVLNTAEKYSWLNVQTNMPDVVSKTEHDNYYNIIPELIRILYDKKLIDAIKIIDDYNNTIFSDFLGYHPKKRKIKIWKRNNKSPAEPILNYRSKAPLPAEIAAYRKNLATLHPNQSEQINNCFYENELIFFNVASKLANSLTYKIFFHKIINKYISHPDMPDELKLDVIKNVFAVADSVIKEEIYNVSRG